MKSFSKILSANTLALCFLCVLMLSFRTANAQRFILGEKFKENGKNWQNTSGKLKTFSSDEIYGHRWTLQTDGRNAYNRSCDVKGLLHVGSGSSEVKTLTLTSTTDFKDVDLVSIKCSSGKPYTLSLSMGNQYNERKNILVSPDDLFSFPTKGACGKLKVQMQYAKPFMKALYLFYIEVASLLSDSKPLLQQHVKPAVTYSYQVQRTLASTHWNTICLPFDVSKEALALAMGKNCELRVFSKEVDNHMLKFYKTDAIEAGVPYLIKPVKEVKNPIFSNVVYKKDAMPQTIQDKTGQYAFIGTFDPVTLNADGHDLLLELNRYLAKPNTKDDCQMYGMRAYFKINERNSTSDKPIKYGIDCSSEKVSGILSLSVHPSKHGQHVYNLQGMDVGTDIHHLPAGVYVIGGKKILKR